MAGMTGRATAASLTERVYGVLRAEILGGHYAPGQRLRPTALATDHQVSANVVREALNRLAGERLLRASPQQGFAVVSVTAADLTDLTEVRGLVETAALRRSIERGDLDWEAALVAAHHRLARTPMTTPEQPDVVSAEWARAHEAFHLATMSGCHSPRLLEVAADLTGSASLYRYWSHRHDRERDVAGEHEGIFEAAVARDAELAVRRHREHIERTAEIVLAALRDDGVAGADPGAASYPAP